MPITAKIVAQVNLLKVLTYLKTVMDHKPCYKTSEEEKLKCDDTVLIGQQIKMTDKAQKAINLVKMKICLLFH